jgi:hypothetical protein
MYANEEGTAVHAIPRPAFEQFGVRVCVLIWKDWVVPALIVRGKAVGRPCILLNQFLYCLRKHSTFIAMSFFLRFL